MASYRTPLGRVRGMGAAKHGVGHYFRNHFNLTTSGNFHTPSMTGAMTEIGADRVMFSIDWPFEDTGQASQWFD